MGKRKTISKYIESNVYLSLFFFCFLPPKNCCMYIAYIHATFFLGGKNQYPRCSEKEFPILAISPSCCIMCMKNSQSHEHVFISCEYASTVLRSLFPLAGKPPSMKKSIFSSMLSWLAILSKRRKKSFGFNWSELSSGLFGGKRTTESSTTNFFPLKSSWKLEPVFVNARGWCKCFYHPFTNYSLNGLLMSWQVLLIP